ncbi:hypothetical protein [Flavivirga spongiicola]|uniref:Uncharacterized protein n=1 Tax=Flavivirga spongiicola TaxID=421621 RepID=A0ABU7XNV8_9FLAO|nr:hypothetical protein [Flavivirga sp. MEBiC05379]MDO5981875.1 hypothetical protein [Flavivirga sp. MEBiC05379]
MYKKIVVVLVIALSFSFASFSPVEYNTSKGIETFHVENSDFGITLRYYNKDSNDHEFKVKTCGSTTKIKFEKSRTSSVTIQTGCSDAIIYDNCKEIKVKKGDKITIKNGCITID